MLASRSSEESQCQQKNVERIKRRRKSTVSRIRLSWALNGLTLSKKEIITGQAIKMDTWSLIPIKTCKLNVTTSHAKIVSRHMVVVSRL